MLQLERDAIEEFGDFVIKNPLTRNEIRRIVNVSKAKSEDDNDQFIMGDASNSTRAKIANEEEIHLLDRALRKSIAVKSTLLNFDEPI